MLVALLDARSAGLSGGAPASSRFSAWHELPRLKPHQRPNAGCTVYVRLICQRWLVFPLSYLQWSHTLCSLRTR